MTRFHRVLSLGLSIVLALGITAPAVALEGPQSLSVQVDAAKASVVKQSTANLNLRQAASVTSASLLVIPKSTKLTVLRSHAGWDQVRHQGKTGWASARYLQVVKTTTSTFPVPVSYRYLKTFQTLRSKAASSSTSLASLHRKTKVEYLGVSGSWTRIKAAGKTGFVPSNQLAASVPATSYRYATVDARLYKSPSTKSTKLSTVKRAAAVQWLRTSGSWAQVSVSGKTGWMESKVLSTTKPVLDKLIGTRWTSLAAVLRAGNYNKSASLGTIKAGEKLRLYQVKGSWSKVKTARGTGWVPTANLVSTVYKPTAATTRWTTKQTSQRVGNSAKSKSQGTLTKSTRLTLLGTSNGWAHVKSGKGTGWVVAKDLSATKPKAESIKSYRWSLQPLQVRSTASNSATSLGTIPAGEKVGLYSNSGSWSKVRTSKGTGWVATSALISTTYKPLTNAKRWTTNNVNLRVGNSTVFRSLGVIAQNTQVKAMGTSNGWTRVSTAKDIGWISTKYLSTKSAAKPVPQEPTVTYRWSTANVNLRAGAGIVFRSLGVVPAGEKVRYLKSSNGWANVMTSKGTGWVSEDYLRSQATTTLSRDGLRVINAVETRFGSTISTIHTIRSGSVGHSSGKAVDLMIKDFKSKTSIAKGDQIAQFLLDNREQLGIYYLIWRDRIWLPGSGWNPYSTSGKYGNQFSGNWNDTTKHNDHIHVEVYGNVGTDRKLDLSELSR